jgi:zinc transport system permease protein
MNTIYESMMGAKYVLLVGPVIGAMCALLSVYIVLRRMALISEGVSHAAFGGISVALLAGYWVPLFNQPLWWEIIAGIFCLATALLIGWVSRKKRVTEDSAIGIFLVTSVAIGQILLRIRKSLGGWTPPNVESLLFGDFANVNATDLIVVSTVLVLVAVVLAVLFYQFLYTTLDEEMARINGVNTKLINVLLLTMISVVIVVCVRMVGSLIITALMIIPGATATMLSRRFSGVMIASLLVGTLGTSAATAVAVVPPFSRLSAGPLVVVTLFLIFAAVWVFRHFFKPKAVDVPGGTSVPEPHDHVHPSSFGHGHVH